jgi:hypothetical protein
MGYRTMNKLLAAFLSIFIAAMPAYAQYQVPNHTVPIGRGIGVTGYGNAAPGIAGLPFVSNGSVSDPSFQVLPNSGLAPAPANTVKGAVNAGTPADLPLPASTCVGLGWTVGTGFTCPPVTVTYVSPLTYGALCDGSTHDEVAFQNALNAAFALGVPLQLPAANCVLNANITDGSGLFGSLIIQGVGSSSRITFLGNFGFAFSSTATYYSLHDFSIACQTTSTSACLSVQNASQATAFGSAFRNIVISQCGAFGMHFQNLVQAYVQNNWILTTSTSAIGIEIDDTATPDTGGNVVTHNNIIGVGGTGLYGLYLLNVGGTDVSTNNIATYQYDIQFQLNIPSGAATGLLLQGNQLDNAQTAGIYYNTSASTGAAINHTINGNTIRCNTGTNCVGIFQAAGFNNWLQDFTVNSNVIRTYSGAGGIQINAGLSYAINGNSISDQAGSVTANGILTGGSGCTVVGNTVTQYSSHLSNGAACTAAGNN